MNLVAPVPLQQSQTSNNEKIGLRIVSNYPFCSKMESSLTQTSRSVDWKCAKSRQLKSECSVDRERAQSSAVEQKAKAARLLAVDQDEVVAA